MPTVEFEFVVQGPPFSVNNDDSKKRRRWKNMVEGAAQKQWAVDERTSLIPTSRPIEVLITTYYTTIEIDVDNVIKPILDALKSEQDGKPSRPKLQPTARFALYVNDNQVYKVTSQKYNLVEGALVDVDSEILADALAKYSEFVHIVIRWEDEPQNRSE